jgi:alanyl aminopeptidase
MGEDSRASARKIRQPIATKHDIANAFDGISYQKGQAVLEMFESWLGEEPFRRGVSLYLKRHAWANATAADFLAALGAASGHDVNAAFSTFLEQTGVPLVAAEVDCTGDTPRLALSQKPYRPIGAEGGADKTWQVPVCVRWGTTAGDRQCTLLQSARAEVVLEKARGCPAWLLPNDRGTGYYRVGYRSEQLPRLLEDGGSKEPGRARFAARGPRGARPQRGDRGGGRALRDSPGAEGPEPPPRLGDGLARGQDHG